jgi:hypothetical protein
MDDPKTIEEVLNEWCSIHEHSNLEPLIQHYKKVYKDFLIVDYAIEGDTIFMTPAENDQDVDVLKLTFKMDTWDDEK